MADKFWGIIYRVDDITDGKFYIGMTTQKEEWNQKRYWGSGCIWRKHRKAHPNNIYKRTILTHAENYEQLCILEVNFIKKFINDKKCMNIKTDLQPKYAPNKKVCSECGGKHYHHYKSCSKYKEAAPCSECGGILVHKKGCSFQKVCPECGGLNNNHKKFCSQYKTVVSRCHECGTANGKHKKWCKFYVHESHSVSKCPICGGLNSWHNENCPNNNLNACPECGRKRGHKEGCSKLKICSECGGKAGNHKKICSKYHRASYPKNRKRNNRKCEECGGLNSYHAWNCSKYKQRKDKKKSNVK